MITLKTLPKATAQEVFDQVVQHLLTQMKTSRSGDSLSGNGCRYRSGTLKCAAGCLIGDDEYNAGLMEQSDWYSLVLKKTVPNAHLTLISELQRIHDNSPPRTWTDQLKNIGVKFNLQFNPPS
jgi:hypothetical protein